MSRQMLLGLAQLTLRDPEAAFRQLRSYGFGMETRWMALLLTISVSAILAWLATQLFPVEVETGLNGLTARPLLLAGSQLVGLVGAVWLITQVGRIFGGTGSFGDALLAMVWIEFLLLVLQAVQVVLMLVFPEIASLMGLFALGLFLYLLVVMIKALHGFQSGPKVAIGLIATVIALGFVFSMIAAVLGWPIGVAR